MIKEYDFDGKLKYEGEYANGERHGKGKEYGRHCKLVYEGEFVNGDRNGKGIVYYYNKNDELDSSFEVEYLDGKRLEGKVNGKEYSFGRLIFEGE